MKMEMKLNDIVLILVVVDDGLVLIVSKDEVGYEDHVLILVVVDDGLVRA